MEVSVVLDVMINMVLDIKIIAELINSDTKMAITVILEKDFILLINRVVYYIN